jgi:5-formyltetrahydrofolate cyclo-ligase
MNAVLSSERRNLLRQAALAQRSSLSGSDIYLRSQQIQARALALACYRSSQAVALYSPIQNEVDTGRLLDHALASGKNVFLPRWSERKFTFARIASRSELAVGRYGILEPMGEVGLSDDDRRNLIAFVPGVMFDSRGRRLGRGGGGYDRLLSQFSGDELAVGLAYDFQVVEDVPVQSWDRSMQYVITENRTIDCQGGSIGN